MDASFSRASIRLESERLYLRPYKPADAAWFYQMALRNRAHLAEFESQNVVMEAATEIDAENIVHDLAAAWTAGKYYFLAAFRKGDDEFIGQVYMGLCQADLPEFEIGYFVDVVHEGQGYITEAVLAALEFAFRELGAHRVRAECDDTNFRSMRVAKRCGFVREGHIRENKRNLQGSFTGTVLYGLLRDEFERARAQAGS